MASKKTTNWGPDNPMLDDFNFDLGDFDSHNKSKKEQKRKPITKIASNVAKGSLGHFTSEQFIRNTVARSLPRGYDTAVDTAYEVKGSFNQLYNTAAEEYRKMRPQLQQTTRRMMPVASKLMPKPLADKLRKFAQVDTSGGQPINPDEAMLRNILGELESTREGERLREYTEQTIKDQIKDQVDTKRFNSNIKVLASIDSRLSQMQAFNDQMFSRYQRRSLEVQYRQYFTQRDILKLLGVEMAQQRQMLQGILQNTALPDSSKRTLSDGVKGKLANFAPLAIAALGGGMMRNLTGKLSGHIQSGGSAFGHAITGLNMAGDATDMAKAMGLDTGGEIARLLGGAATGFLMRSLMGQMGRGFGAGGFTAQKGAQAGRLAKSLPDLLSQYAGSRTKRTGVAGTAEQFIKDLMIRHTDNRRVGGSAIMEAGEQGYYSKKSQKSVEEIIPGFLSKIHHELAMMRTGDHKTQPIVWNDDKDDFTTASEKTASVRKRIFDNKNMQFAQQAAKEFVDQLTAGTTLSPQAYQALNKQVLTDVLAGKPLDYKKYLRPSKDATHLAPHRAEIMSQMRGRFKGPGGKTDQVLLQQLHDKYGVVRNTTPNVSAQIDAYRQLGSMNDLRKLGLVTEEGDNVFLNHDTLVNHMAGQAPSGPVTAKAQRGDHLGSAARERVSFKQRINETYVDLYKPADLNTPVIVGVMVSMGKYQNAKTGEPILLMKDLLNGVLQSGKVIASGDEVKKLVTGSNEPFMDFLQRTKVESNGKKGRLAKAADYVGAKAAGAGSAFDHFMDHGAGAQLRTKGGRRRMAQGVAANVAQAAASVQSKIKGASPTVYDSLIASVKSGWKKAMNVGAYAISLYKGSSTQAVVDAARLKAGEYVSAKTGRVIKDMRNIVEGVKDGKTGEWVATPQEVVDELRTETGAKFVDLVNKAQEGLSAGAEAVKGTTVGHAVLTPEGRSEAFHKTADAASSVQESIHQAGESQWEPLMDLLKAFKEGNLQHLEDILEVLSDRDFTQTGGNVMGAKGAGGKKKRWWHGSILDNAKGAGRNAAGLLRKGAGLYGNYVKTVFGLPFKAAGHAMNFLGRGFDRGGLGKSPADVYVKGEKTPRLIKGSMEAGEYFNTKPDKTRGMIPTTVIHVPKDIKGPVMDRQGNTLISLDDYKKGLTDNQGHSFVGNVIRGLWSAATTIGGFYGSLLTLPIKMISGAGKLAGEVFNLAKMPVDVYVKGDMPWEPRLTAMGMRAGIYVLKDKPSKKVRNVQDVTGEVMDISKPHPEQKIFTADFSKGLVDARGKPFPVKASMLARLAGGALGLAGAAAGAYMKTIGAMLKFGGKVAAAPFNLLANMLGMGPFGKRAKMPKDGFPTHDEKTHTLLNDILSTLQQRLADPKKQRANSYAEELKQHAALEAAEHHGIVQNGESAGNGAMTDKTGAGDLMDGIKSKLKGAKGLWDDLKKGKGILGKGKKGLAAGGKKVLDFLKKLKNGGKVAGEAGEVAEGAEAVEGTAAAGEAVAGTATAAEGIAAAGAAVEGGGLLAGAASVGGGILAGIGAVLSAPVVLAALAVGAIAYGGYKLYSNYKLKGQKLRSLRMAQYGVDVDKDLSNSKNIGDLEALLEPHVTVSQGKATIDAKSMKKDDLVKITKIFGFNRSNWNPMNWFHKGTVKEANQQKAMGHWMEYRFKPVFLNWIQAVHAQKPDLSVSDVDAELKPEQKRALLKQVMAIDAKIYDDMTTPFKDDPLTAGSKEVAAAQLAVLKDLGPEKKNDKGALAQAGGAAAGVAGAAAVGLKGAIPAKAAVAAAGGAAAAGALVAATKDATGKNGNTKVGLAATSNLKSDFGFLGGKISALTAVRYKTYGLTEMDPTKAKALFLLEQDVFEKIEFSSDGTASFKDDASYYFDHYQGYFGVSPSDQDAKTRWYSWFAKRFVPTILQFSTAVKHANKTVDPRDAENYLGPEHLLDVANMTIAATFGSKLFASSVWSYTDTPFGDNKPLNNDSNSTKDNIQALKDAVQKQVLQEQKAKTDASKAAQQQQQAGASSAKDNIQAAAGGVTAKAGTSVTAQTQAQIQQAVKLPPGVEAGSSAAQSIQAAGGKPGAPVGQTVAQPGNGTSGDINKVPQPSGSGYSGVKATLDAAAKMTGVDPKLLGTFTGIESGWNPNAAAGTSSAKGLGQFLDSTWRAMLSKYGAKYGINPNTPQTDPRASALMLAEYIKENQAYLTKNLGRTPTDTELYIAHFLGPAGAVQLLSAPDNAIGAAISPKAAAANAPIFYRNGAALSKADVVKVLDGRVSKFRAKVSAAGPSLPGSATTDPNASLASTKAAPGAKTTTTANGSSGGLGAGTVAPKGPTAATAASGSAALASITPPSGATGGAGGGSSMPVLASLSSGAPSSAANDGSSDPVVAQQAQQTQKATMADRAAQATTQAQVGASSDMVALTKQQNDLLRQAVQLLTSIDGSAAGLAKAGMGGGNANNTASAGTVPDPAAPPATSPGGTGKPQAAPLPNAPISVARPQYG